MKNLENRIDFVYLLMYKTETQMATPMQETFQEWMPKLVWDW